MISSRAKSILLAVAALGLGFGAASTRSAADDPAPEGVTGSPIPAAAPAPAPAAGGLRINQIQVIGTHNSYHLRKTPKVLNKAWDYEHASIDEQLERGVRSFELDFNLRADGWRVMHIPKLDDNSSCPMLVDCIRTVKRWSKAHPRHVPITFLCEVKEEGWGIDKTLLGFDAAGADRLDAEIRGELGPSELITPDDVRGDAATLAEAVATRGWPLLEESRGKFFFILHEEGALRDTYVEGHPSLRGRAMFVRSSEGRPDCAVMVEDNPNVERVQGLVRKGIYVRSRADTEKGADGGPAGMTRVDAALACGSQIISTDHPAGEPDPETGQCVTLPGGGPARCNPVNTAEGEDGGAELE